MSTTSAKNTPDIVSLLIVQSQHLHLLLKVVLLAKASHVSVETGSGVRFDQFLGGKVQTLQEGAVLTEHVLLMVAGMRCVDKTELTFDIIAVRKSCSTVSMPPSIVVYI